MIPYTIIATGSDGNATLLNNSILVDCGVSVKALAPYIRDISVVFLTHRHSDHFKRSTVRNLAEVRPTLRFACLDYMAPELADCGVPLNRMDILQPDQTARYRLLVRPFLLKHDVPNCGYRFIFPDGSRVFYATDTANLNGIDAKNYDLYLIEANHRKAEIEARIEEKKANAEYAYELRAERNHLSEEAANDWLLRNMGPSSEFIYMHQHKEVEKCSTQ